jgi:glycopeptide antibiotics resistance protein
MARVSPLWWYWIPLVWIISSPWVGFTREPQWKRVHLVPFSDPADSVTDVVGNVLLFVPFGYSAARRPGAIRSIAFAATAAAAVSVAAEASQLFSTERYPSATDVLMAVTGAALGAGWRKLIGLM